jgi:hypothetical protein
MGRFPALVRFGSKLVLEIMPSVAATVIGGYLLTQLHFSRTPEPPAPQPQAAAAPAPAAAPEVPTLREDRAAMREVLKERRENPEAPAVVRPVVAAAPANPPAPPAAAASVLANPPAPVTAQLPTAMDSISPNEPVEHVSPSRPNLAAAPVALPRTRPNSVASVYAPAPPPGLPPAPAIGVDSPLQVSPVTPGAPAAPAGPLVANPPPPPLTAEAPRRHGVLSTLSSIVGGAASATGNTVNWVIDLPGKAIDAGGRVIGIENSPPPPPRPFS